GSLIVPSNPGAPPAKREGIHPWSSPPSVALGLGSASASAADSESDGGSGVRFLHRSSFKGGARTWNRFSFKHIRENCS
uniref:Uncharacterized protein n=1 Tax=Aegilops tauschii subsp. strangulata TaxID=200361 RepID=A0A453K3I0_AEGTS